MTAVKPGIDWLELADRVRYLHGRGILGVTKDEGDNIVEALRLAARPSEGVIRVLAIAPEKCDCGFCDGLLYLNRASYCCDRHTSVEFHIDYCEAPALTPPNPKPSGKT